MIRDKKEMLNFEEVDKIETFFGLNKGMILGRELIEIKHNKKTTMKIAIEAQRIFRTNKHGMDFVALESIRELQKIDHENEYFIFVTPGEDRCLEESENVHIIELKCPTYPLWEQVALPRAVKKIMPDLLHCTSNTAPLQCPVPLILTLHDILHLPHRAVHQYLPA